MVWYTIYSAPYIRGHISITRLEGVYATVSYPAGSVDMKKCMAFISAVYIPLG